LERHSNTQCIRNIVIAFGEKRSREILKAIDFNVTTTLQLYIKMDAYSFPYVFLGLIEYENYHNYENLAKHRKKRCKHPLYSLELLLVLTVWVRQNTHIRLIFVIGI